MIRLVHLSDIHVTAPALEWQWADWFNKRYAAWFNFRWLGRRYRFRHAEEVLDLWMQEIRVRRPDHIIFSGDATALGFESEMRHAVEMLGVQSGMSGLAVPGNHDYCTPPAAASGLFERYFAPWQTGQRLDGSTYPFAQRVGPAWLVAVNSLYRQPLGLDAGGSAGPEQLQRLQRLLANLDPGLRILVTHYPVCLASGKRERRSHGLRDLDDLVKIAVAGGVCLWLHGHRHHFYHHLRTDLAPFPVLCIGSATQTGLWSYGDYTLEDRNFHAQIRVFDLATMSFQNGPAVDLQLTC